MTNHPADPRSDANGEQPFDMLEYPYRPYTPPPAPPGPGNVHNYIPNRGQVNHGVQITRDPDADIARDLPFTSDQKAQDRYNDPKITPRDLVPVKPVPVQIVERPDLLRRRKVHTASYTVAAGAPGVLVAPFDPQRTRLVLNVVTTDTVVAYLSNSPDAIEPNAFVLAPGAPSIETAVTDAVYVFTRWIGEPDASPTGARVGVWIESTQSDGDPLL